MEDEYSAGKWTNVSRQAKWQLACHLRRSLPSGLARARSALLAYGKSQRTFGRPSGTQDCIAGGIDLTRDTRAAPRGRGRARASYALPPRPRSATLVVHERRVRRYRWLAAPNGVRARASCAPPPLARGPGGARA